MAFNWVILVVWIVMICIVILFSVSVYRLIMYSINRPSPPPNDVIRRLEDDSYRSIEIPTIDGKIRYGIPFLVTGGKKMVIKGGRQNKAITNRDRVNFDHAQYVFLTKDGQDWVGIGGSFTLKNTESELKFRVV